MNGSTGVFQKRSTMQLFAVLAICGFGYFAFLISEHQPSRAWPVYLINLLLWSAIAQGGLLFSMIMHVTKARWSNSFSGLSEAFTAFFPFSFFLFLLLFFGREYVFPWLHEDLHGKDIWLNLPFLFSRDLAGLFVLYALGFAFVFYSLGLRLGSRPPLGKIRSVLYKLWSKCLKNENRCRSRMTLLSVLYMIVYGFVLSLIAFDLVMGADPHWISTLFGAYAFVKAFYIGLGGLIILASIVFIRYGPGSGITRDHFHDVGKLFFGFCLIWGDFFYAQFVVIWYGNIPEETQYLIRRTMLLPWQPLAWGIFIICFILPFLILLNRKVKSKPVFMSALSSIVILGMGLEHLLLLGPALNPQLNLSRFISTTAVIFLGFFGLIALSLGFFLNLFPELVRSGAIQGESENAGRE